MVENYTGMLLSMARSRLFGKPFTVSEWDFVNPNPFVVEGAFETGACAAAQGWSSLERFCYGFGDYSMRRGNPAIGTFSMTSDPLRLLSERAGVLFFLRGDVRESEKVYPILLPRDYFSRNRMDTPSALLNRLALLGKTGLVLCDSVRDAELPPGTVHAVSLDETAAERKTVSRVPAAVRKLKLDRTRFRNDTGEITLDAEQGTFLVQTEKSEAFLLKEGNRLQGKFASVENRRSFCALLLSAMDGKSLKESGRFLILHLTQTVNRGMTFRTQDCSVLETWSEKPSALLFRRGEADLIVNRDLSGFQLYALNLARGGSYCESGSFRFSALCAESCGKTSGEGSVPDPKREKCSVSENGLEWRGGCRIRAGREEGGLISRPLWSSGGEGLPLSELPNTKIPLLCE